MAVGAVTKAITAPGYAKGLYSHELEILPVRPEVKHGTGRTNENHGDQCDGSRTVSRSGNIIQIRIINGLVDRLLCTTCALAGSGIVVMISLLCDCYAALLTNHLMGPTVLVVNQLLTAVMVTSIGLDCTTGTYAIFIKYMLKLLGNHDAAIPAGCLVGLSVTIVCDILESMLTDRGILLIAAGVALAIPIVIQAVHFDKLAAAAVDIMGAVTVGGDTGFEGALMTGILLVAAGVALAIPIVIQTLHIDKLAAAAVDIVGAVTVGGDAGFEGALMTGILLVAAGVALAVTIVVQAVHFDKLAAAAVDIMGAVTVGGDTGFEGALMTGIHLVTAGVALAITITVKACKEPINLYTAITDKVMGSITIGITVVIAIMFFSSHSRHGDNTDQHCQCHQHCQEFLVHFFFFTSLYGKDF